MIVYYVCMTIALKRSDTSVEIIWSSDQAPPLADVEYANLP